MLLLLLSTAYAAAPAAGPGGMPLPITCSMQTRATCKGPSAAMGGEVCMWNGEDHMCTSVEGDNNVGDWCKQYGPMEAAQCQQDPKCMWEAADGECDAAKMPMPLLPGVGTPGSTSGVTIAGMTTGGTVGAGFTSAGTVGTGFTSGTVTGADAGAGTVTGFTSAGATSAGSITGDISAGATSSGSTAGSTAPGAGALQRMPCKMRPMAQCTGLSPTGGHCYYEEGKCDESEAGSMEYICITLNMDPVGCNNHPHCFYDAADAECTEAKEREMPPIMPGAGTTAGFTAAGSTTGFTAAGSTSGSSGSGSTSAGTTAGSTMGGMTICWKVPMMQCASTPGCFIDENECKNIGGGGMEAPEAPEAPEMPEAPEGAWGFPPAAGAQSNPFGGPLKNPRPQEESSKKTIFGLPSWALYGLGGFFSALFISLGIYLLTCARQKRTTGQDLFLDDFSSRNYV